MRDEARRELVVDLATILARLEQINAANPDPHWLWDRVMTCDVPRLRIHLARFETDEERRIFETEDQGPPPRSSHFFTGGDGDARAVTDAGSSISTLGADLAAAMADPKRCGVCGSRLDDFGRCANGTWSE